MSQEKPNDDPRQQNDWGSHAQTSTSPGRAIRRRSRSPATRSRTWRNGTRPKRTNRVCTFLEAATAPRLLFLQCIHG